MRGGWPFGTLGAATATFGQQAESPAADDRWTITAAPYLWATPLKGDATVAGTEADVDVPFGDIVKDLSVGAMLLVGVNQGRFGIGVNSLFARVSPDSDAGGVEIDATSDTVQLVVAPTGASSTGNMPCRFRADPCACMWRRRPAFASPICAPNSRCGADRPFSDHRSKK